MLRKREFLVTLKNMLSDEQRWRDTMRAIADDVWDEMDADGNGRWVLAGPETHHHTDSELGSRSHGLAQRRASGGCCVCANELVE